MSARGPDVSKASLQRGHEQTDLSIRTLFFGLVMLTVATVLAVWLMAVMFDVLDARQAGRAAPGSPLVENDVTPPEPRLENSPREVRDRIDALREMQETTYTWLDRQAGVARIPVSRAMEILAERGLPHRPALEQQP